MAKGNTARARVGFRFNSLKCPKTQGLIGGGVKWILNLDPSFWANVCCSQLRYWGPTGRELIYNVRTNSLSIPRVVNSAFFITKSFW